MAYRSRYLNLDQAFPPDDALANVVFRLCIFREDLMLELMMMSQDNIDPLDRYGDFARRMYAMRRATISLFESKEAMCETPVNLFVRDAENREAVSMFDAQRKDVKKRVHSLKAARDKMGAHIDADVIDRLINVHGQENDRLTISSSFLRETMYPLPVHSLSFGYAMTATNKAEAIAQFGEVLENMRHAHEAAIQAVDTLVILYLRERGIWQLLP